MHMSTQTLNPDQQPHYYTKLDRHRDHQSDLKMKGMRLLTHVQPLARC